METSAASWRTVRTLRSSSRACGEFGRGFFALFAHGRELRFQFSGEVLRFRARAQSVAFCRSGAGGLVAAATAAISAIAPATGSAATPPKPPKRPPMASRCLVCTFSMSG